MLLLNNSIAFAQWNLRLNAGAAIPLTGYSEVVNTRYLIGIDGHYRLKETFSLGLETALTRLVNDKDATDEFMDARLTIAPLLFVAEKELSVSALRPYIAAGLGISFFNLHYETSPTEGHTDSNVSFTMAPQLGLKYLTSASWSYFVETDLVLLADGPPQGLPMGEKMTGYWGIKIGASYTFKKSDN